MLYRKSTGRLTLAAKIADLQLQNLLAEIDLLQKTQEIHRRIFNATNLGVYEVTNRQHFPCPFCGTSPVFPDAKDVYGTCYDAGCEECGIATISLQIIDCFDHPRSHVHDSWNKDTFQYGLEYIEVARQEAISMWNTRAT